MEHLLSAPIMPLVPSDAFSRHPTKDLPSDTQAVTQGYAQPDSTSLQYNKSGYPPTPGVHGDPHQCAVQLRTKMTSHEVLLRDKTYFVYRISAATRIKIPRLIKAAEFAVAERASTKYSAKKDILS